MIPASASPLLLAGAAEEAAYTISRSIRLNSADSAYLSRTPSSAGNRKTWTWSGWVKRSKLGGFQCLFAVSGGDAFRFENSPSDTISLNNGGTAVLKTSGVFRDLSAWYHVVLSVDTTQSSNRAKIYVNGELQVQGDPYALNEDTPFNSTVVHEIGRNPAATTRLFDGYLADVILVDGQALDPTSFGEFDEYNNWQPKAYTGSYGTNGFHLDFSDATSTTTIAEDSSGNNNDWTANNISVVTGGGRYASDLTANQTFAYPAINAFNGVQPSGGADTSNFARLQNSSGIFTFSPTTSIDVSSTVGCWVSQGGYIEFDGQTSSTAGAGGAVVTITVSSATSISSSNTLVVKNTTYATNLGTVVVDGVMLIDYAASIFTGQDSLFDSPTNSGTDTGAGGELSGNYCTWNPLDNGSVTLSNGNLDGSATVAWKNVRGTIAFPSSGKWYYEVTPGGSALLGIGIAAANKNLTDQSTGTFVTYNEDGRFYKDGSIIASGKATYTSGDVIGVVFDCDTNSVTFYKNNVSQGSVTPTTGVSYFPFIQIYNSSLSANWGQRPFAHDISVGITDATGAIPILSTSDDYGQTLSSGTASDSNSSSLVLALPMNGTNGGTTFTDYSATIKGSGSAKTVTANGDAQTSTTESKWYGSSGKFDGSGDRLDIASTADFNLGSSWTIEYWFYTAGTAVTRHYYFHNNANNLQSATSGTQLLFYNGSSSVTFGSLQLNNWHHVAAVNTAGTVSFYIDGIKQSSTIAAGSVSTSLALTIGAFTDGTVGFNGYMQDFRIYNGVAKYTSNFTPPSSALFKALCTANLDEPTVPDGSTAMDVALYTGNGSTQTISGLGHSPDLVWIKNRTDATSHMVFDIVRGVQKVIYTNATTQEQPASISVTAFNSDGFTVGSANEVNGSNDAMAAWTWDGGSSTVSNTDGSITSSVRANPTAGFSIVSYTGNGTNGATVGHSLNVEPHFLIIKDRDASTDWAVFHKFNVSGSATNPARNSLYLNKTNASANNNDWPWNNTLPSSSVITLNNTSSTSKVNTSGNDYVAYCFAPVEGYSAVGKWTGGSDAFVYLGFRPKWLLVKASASGYEWLIFDSERSTYNLVDDWLVANTAAAEVTSNATNNLDFLSNGFKIKGTGGYFGVSTDMLYLAFAEHPFRVSRAR